MKRLMKRWLAMLLAVLMVMGTLPTTALAARVDGEEQSENPVLEQGDGVADTLKKDDEETPEKPVDPDNPDSADSLWNNVSVSATIDADGNWKVTVQLANLSESAPDPQDWGVLLVPAYAVSGYGHPNDVNVSDGGNIGTYDSLRGRFRLINHKNETMYGINGTGLGGGLTYENGTFTAEGTLPALDQVIQAVNGLGVDNGPTDSVNFRVLFLSKGSTGDSTHVVSTQATYASGARLNDATYVLNLNGNSVKRMDGTTLVEDAQASYSAVSKTLTLPIHNTSAGPVYAAGSSTKGFQTVQITTQPASGCSWSPTPGLLEMDPTKAAPTVGVLYENPVAGETMVITVPYYEAEVDSDALPTTATPGTAKITVLVVNSTQVVNTNPITIHVKEGYAADDPNATVAITLPGTYSRYASSKWTNYTAKGIYFFAASPSITFTGDAAAIAKLSASEGTSKWRPGTSEGGFRPVIYAAEDAIDSSKVTAKTADAAPNAKLTLAPGLPKGTYQVSMDLGKLSACSDTGSVHAAPSTMQTLVPVTVIVDPGTVTPTYTYDYELTYDLNGGTGTIPNNPDTHSTPATTATTDSHTFTLPANPTKDNHTFAGWKVDGTETVLATTATTYIMTGIQNSKATAKLIAQWTENPKYTVSFAHSSAGRPADANITTGLPTSTTPTSAWPGGSVSWMANPAATGWTFLGWSTASNATVAGVGDATTKSYTLPDNTAASVTLYAVWEQIFHHVTYDFGTVTESGSSKAMTPWAIGGSAAVGKPTQADVADTTGTFNVATALTKDATYTNGEDGLGYVFKGWLATGGATGTHDPGDSITMGTSDITLTAQWEKRLLNVTYDKGSIATTDATAAANVTLPDNGKPQYNDDYSVGSISGTLTDTDGWRFDTWNDGAADHAAGSSIDNIQTDYTLTAKWKVKVSFDAQGGSAVADQWPGEGTKATEPSCSWTGHTLAGWYDKASGGNKIDFSTKTFSKPTTLYAHWTELPGAAKITLNLDSNSKYTGKTVTVNGETATEGSGANAGVYTTEKKIPAGTYEVMVGGKGTGVSVTVPMNGTGEASVQYWTVTVTTDGNGQATMTPAAANNTGDTAAVTVDSTTTTKTAVVQEGASVTWAFSTPNTYYQANHWDSGSSTDDITTKPINGDAVKTHTAHFSKKPATVTVQFRVDGSNANPGGTQEVKLGASGTGQTLGSSATTLTFNVDQGSTYDVYLNGTKYGTTPTVDGNKTFNIDFYKLKVQVASTGHGSVATSEGTSVSGTATEVVVLAGADVAVSATPDTNYVFGSWTVKAGTGVTAPSAAGGNFKMPTSGVTLEASFTKGKYTGYVTVTWNGADATTANKHTATVTVNGKNQTVDKDHTTVSFADLEQGKSYDVTVTESGNTLTFGTQLSESHNASDKALEIPFVSAEGVTNGNGTVAVSAAGYTTKTTATTASASVTLWVLSKTSVTWTAAADPSATYEFKKWEDDSTTTPRTEANMMAAKKHTATFGLKQRNITVNIFKDGTDAANKYTTSGTVELWKAGGSAAVKTGTVSSANTVSIAAVEYGSYELYWKDSDYTTKHKVADITVSDSNGSFNVVFYTLTVNTTTEGYVKQSRTSIAPADVGTDTSTTGVYLPQTTVYVSAKAQTDFAWASWTDSGLQSHAYTTGTSTATLTAAFQRVAFTVKLTLNLDDQAKTALDNAGGDVTALEAVRVSGDADSSAHPLTYADGKWGVSGLKTGTTYKITVTTRTGTYDAITNLTTDKDDGVINLYSLNVAAGTYGNATNKPYVTNDATKPTKAVVLKGTSVPLNANPDNNGWTVTGWVAQGTNAAPENMTVTTTAATFGDDYAAATAGTGVTLTPEYQYSTTVVTSYGGTPQNVTSVSVGGGSVGSPSPAGNYKITGLTPGTTYTVTVNGFASSVTFNHGKAGDTVPVEIYSVAVNKQTAVSGETIDGTVKIGIGDTATSDGPVYLPEGAKTDDTHKVTVAATTGTKYRLKTGTGEHPWTAATYVNNQDATTTTVKTPDDGMEADIIITADFVRQWTVSTEVTGVDPHTSTATIDGSTSKTVDDGTVVTVTFTKGTGETLVSWTGANGTFYTDATGTTTKTPTAADATVYFKPTGDNAKVTATIAAAKYPVSVAVKLDNEKYSDRVVTLKQGSEVKYTLPEEMTADATPVGTGIYSNAEVYAGTYDIFVDGNDTGKDLSFTPEDAENKASTTVTAPDPTKLTSEKNVVRYYTINLVATPGTDGTNKNTVRFKADAASTANTTVSKIFLAGAEQNIEILAAPFTGDAYRHRFGNWAMTKPVNTDTPPAVITAAGSFGHTTTQADETFKLPAEDTLKDLAISPSNQITLTATFISRIKVSVGKGTRPHAGVTPQIAVTGGTLGAGPVYVDAGETITLGVDGSATTNPFKEWSAPDGTGTFDSTKTQYTEGAVFTPTKDVTLSLNLWLDATRAGAWVYEKVAGVFVPTTGNSNIVWTANDAQTPKSVKVTESDGTTPVTPALTTSDYTLSGNTYTIKTDYLKKLPAGNYKVIFTYDLGDADHPKKLENQTKDVNFEIQVTAKKLTKTTIEVAENGKDTLNVHVPNTSKQDIAQYVSHEDPLIVPHDTLTLKWFWSATKPAQKVLNETEIAGITAATPTYPGGATWTPLTGTNAVEGFTGTATPYTAVPNYDGGGVTQLQGKYVFAVATAATTGTGSVITNAIPVDYDAKVTVRVDETPITDNATRFVVYLRPVTANTSTEHSVQTGDIAATWNATTKRYETTGSKLTGGVTYQVWVNEVSGVTSGDNLYLMNTGETVSSGPDANQTATVDFYSVNLTNVNAGKVTHAKDKDDVDVGEKFTDYPSLSAAVTGTTRGVNSGAAVLTGTLVTASTTTWGQDYTLIWQKSTENNALEDTTSKQNSGATAATFANGAVTAKTNIGARMNQNTHAIKGGIVGSGTLTGATLTFGTHVFEGSVGDSTWTASQNRITFQVPRTTSAAGSAITGDYTLAASPKAGTTVMGYDNKWTATAPTPYPNNTSVGVTAQANDKFTIFIAETKLRLELTDNHTEAEGTSHTTGAEGTNTGTAEHDEQVVFANYDAITRRITVTNKGNTKLKVGLSVYIGAGTDNKLTLPDDSHSLEYKIGEELHATISGPTETKLSEEFELAVNEARDFTLEIPAGLEYDDDKFYRFVFETKDGRDGTDQTGPTLEYDFDFDVEPVTVTKVETQHNADYTQYKVIKTTIKENGGNLNDPQANGASFTALQRPQDNTTTSPTYGLKGDGTPKDDNDLVYEWYVCDKWNAKVVYDETEKRLELEDGTALTKLTNGVSKDTLTYDLQPEAKGKTLYLLVKGQNNASGIATTPDVINVVEPPMILPFSPKVIVRENESPIPNNGTGDYTVYLWNKTTADKAGVTAFDKTNTTYCTTAVWTKPDGADGYFLADNLMPGDRDGGTFNKYTYQIYTNVVKGDTGIVDTGLTIDIDTTNATQTVDFYSLDVSETTYTNGKYEDALKDTTKFFTESAANGRKTGLTPEAKVTVNGAEVQVGQEGNANRFVRKGTAVSLTEDPWTKDYTIAWTKASEQGTSSAAAGSTAKIASLAAETTVTTKLTLKLYNVTATVLGMGAVKEITMKMDDDHIFSTKNETGKILGIGTAVSSIGVNQSVTFQLPMFTTDGGYATEADKDDAYELQGYRTPSGTGTIVQSNFKVSVNADTTFDVLLQGDGFRMDVGDDVPTQTGLATNSPTAALGTGSYNTTAGASNGTATQEIHLNYNYGAPQKVKLSVTNKSKQPTDGSPELNLYDVTFTQTKAEGNIAPSTTDTNDFTATVDEIGKDDEKEMTLTVPADLTAGTYEYVGEFSFKSEDNGANGAKVTYTLKVVVEKLPFNTVNAVPNAAGTGYESTEYTVDVQNDAGNDLKNDSETGLAHNTDYHYQWVTFPIGTTPSVTIESDGSLTVNGDKVGTDSTDYTPTPADQGKDLRLVIYATQGGNASGYAISAPVTLTYEGIVYVAVDGTTLASATEPNPSYKVEFRAESETAIQGTWQAVSGATGKYAYVADLTPGKDYDVYVSRYAGDTTAADFVKIATLNGNNIGTALDHDPAFTNVTQAEYFTVHAQDFTEVEFKTGTGETFAAHVKPAVELESTDISVDGKPVLKNQRVQANVTGGWMQDYNLLWQFSKTGTDFDQTWKVKTATGKQTKTQAAADNAFTKTITEETYIGGRLDQNTYTVTGKVKNPTGMTGGSVDSVKLAFQKADDADARAFTFTTGTEAGTTYKTGTLGDKDNNGLCEPGDDITFEVVRGSYGITATEGAKTTLQYVTIGGTGDSQVTTETKGPDRYTHTLAPTVADDTRLFAVYVAEKKLNLGLTDGTTSSTTQQNEAGATVGNNGYVNKDHTLYYDGTKTNPGDKDTFALTLSNPTANGNGDLTVSASVYKFNKSDTIPNYDNASGWSALTAGTISGGTYTDPDNSKVVITGLPSSLSLPVSDTNTEPGGSVSVSQDAANTADAIYVVRFTSVRTGTAEVGPTIYYKLDFTVNPLPIEEVKKPTANTTTGALSVSSTDAFDDVTVSYMEGSTKQTADADERGLDGGDVIYVWAKAPANVTVTKDSFTLADNADIAVSAAGTAAGVELVTAAGSSNTTYTPNANTEQGMNFYVLAVRNKANDSNASGFAVSEAMYAQVKVAVKAYQTGGTTEIPVTDDFNVVGTLGEGDAAVVKKAQDGEFTVTGDDAKTISFTATQADNADPDKAKYYFVGWGDTAANFTSTTDTDTTYTVTKKDTVIGYYDLLPTLTGDCGYNINEHTGTHTFTYTKNDASGNLSITMTGKFKGETTARTQTLTASAFSSMPAAGVVTGDYVLDTTWIETNLDLDGIKPNVYTVIFYDNTKGALADGGYAGYDEKTTISISAAEVEVTAQAENENKTGSGDPVYHGTVKAGTAEAGRTSKDNTNGGRITVVAIPDAGYEFAGEDGWKIVNGEGGFGDSGDDATWSEPTAIFTPGSTGCIVEASFKAGTVTAADIKATVIYGNTDFEVGSTTQVTGASTAAGADFEYTLVDPTALPEWLELDDTTGQFSVKAGSKVNTNVESSTTDSYTAVTDEIVLEVKVTDKKSGANTTVTFTIDVEPGELTINDEAFTVPGDALGGQPVDLTQFTYASVTDQASTEVIKADGSMDLTGDHTEKGTWSVVPTNYVGNDRENPAETSEYTFTFTYGPAADTAGAEKWNYKPTEKKLSFHVDKPPQTIYIADQIKNGSQVVAGTTYQTQDGTDMTGKNNDVPVKLQYAVVTKRLGETITYLDADPTYTVKIKGEGNLYGMSLTKKELVGFDYATGVEPTVEATWADGDTLDFGLKLTAMDTATNKWVGVHTATFEVTGYSEPDAENQTDATKITATYELTVKILPRVITKLDVTVTDPDETVTEATPTIDGNPPIDEDGRDEKGNTPIKDVTVVWGPEENKPDGKNTEVKVDVEIDPNYVYAEENDETPEKEDITENTGVRVTDHLTPDPDVQRDETDGDHIIHIDQKIPYLMHADVNAADATDVTGPKVNDQRTININKGGRLETYTIDLGAYGADLYDVQWTVVEDTVTPADTGLGATLGELPTGFDLTAGDKQSVTLDLSAADTSKPNTYKLTLLALGKANATDPDDARTIRSTYALVITIRKPNDPYNPPEPECPCKVFYHVGTHGVTEDATIEDVSEKNRPSKIPAITALDGYVFRGWSLTDPATLKDGEKAELVDPRTVEAEGEAMTFYAIFVESGVHKHYIVGYPNGNFGPADNITRASVATIIARAVLSDFVEGSDYGNPGNYNDVEDHWAASAIAYCSKFGVFKGYEDGTFRPDEPITRQEFATVMARMDGELTAEDIPFDDIDEAGEWALDGIYTSYEKGWVDGYTDGTFRPLNNIRRDEAVKIFNAYLYRGVDADGLSDLYEHAQGVIGNGENEYKTWTDVPEGQWAYYEIIEASNDHEYALDFEAEKGYTVPEHWVKCWLVDHARSRVKTESAETAAAAVASGFRVWFH